MKIDGCNVLVTGGASFIGSHLVDALIERGARVRVADNLSSGSLANLGRRPVDGSVEFIECDLREPNAARAAVDGRQLIFHLAADHGGRGYVDTHQAGPASNLALDGLVFREAVRAGVEKVVYASSGCVYPNRIQGDADEELFLTEEMVRPPYDADNLYGWAKLMAELTLRAYHAEFGLNAACCRYFTVYGPRAKENLAVLAMIARAFIGEKPFEIWGDGRQVRNFTHVDDIVSGTIAAAEKIDDATPVNLGTMERIRVREAAEMVLEMTGHDTEIVTRPEMPTGPVNRVADNRLAKELLGWQPQVAFREGLRRTIDWYYATKNREKVRQVLKRGALLERGPAR
ncbi:MAG: NAD-dependent epimerase/dehydratase family protein [Candidatus Nealsonbacteria bacterium]|nr:NAD-dependent epimerase/dehydratase family protein [Candidatus Nealsonbacteria bacterium]